MANSPYPRASSSPWHPFPFGKAMLQEPAPKGIGAFRQSHRLEATAHGSGLGRLHALLTFPLAIEVKRPALPTGQRFNLALDGKKRLDAKLEQFAKERTGRVVAVSKQVARIQPHAFHRTYHLQRRLALRRPRAACGACFQDHTRANVHQVVNHVAKFRFLVKYLGVQPSVRIGLQRCVALRERACGSWGRLPSDA